MKFSKTEMDNMKKIDNMVNDLDNCGDKYCGNIITSHQIKEEGIKFLKNVTISYEFCKLTAVDASFLCIVTIEKYH